MARLNVNPTRMELKKLKGRLSTAVRGHKLLKDKCDEMVRRYSLIVRETSTLRMRMEDEMASCLRQFAMVSSLMPAEDIELAFSMPASRIDAAFDTTNIMGVDVPRITVSQGDTTRMPYAYAGVTSEADFAVRRVAGLVGLLLKLGEVEKASGMLALEIERNKRRVNALEYVMIPQIEETIKYIKSKLDENERSAVARLMKVKSMLNAEEE